MMVHFCTKNGKKGKKKLLSRYKPHINLCFIESAINSGHIGLCGSLQTFAAFLLHHFEKLLIPLFFTELRVLGPILVCSLTRKRLLTSDFLHQRVPKGPLNLE